MRIIPVWINKQPRKSWYSIYSYMLSPGRPKLRDAIFSYYYLRYLSKNQNKYHTSLESQVSIKTVNDLLHALKFKSFAKELDRLDECVRGSGIIFRLMYGMQQIGETPTLNKAVDFFKRGFKSQEAAKGYVPFLQSTQDIKRYYEYRSSVFHLCAAYTIVKPLKPVSGKPLRDRIFDFLAISERFRINAQLMKKGNPDGGKYLPLIDPEMIYHVSPKIIPNVSLENYKIEYPREKIRKYFDTYVHKNTF